MAQTVLYHSSVFYHKGDYRKRVICTHLYTVRGWSGRPHLDFFFLALAFVSVEDSFCSGSGGSLAATKKIKKRIF